MPSGNLDMIVKSLLFDPLWDAKDAEKQSRMSPGHETFLRHTGNAKRRIEARARSTHLTVENATRPPILQPKQMPAGYSARDYSKN